MSTSFFPGWKYGGTDFFPILKNFIGVDLQVVMISAVQWSDLVRQLLFVGTLTDGITNKNITEMSFWNKNEKLWQEFQQIV